MLTCSLYGILSIRWQVCISVDSGFPVCEDIDQLLRFYRRREMMMTVVVFCQRANWLRFLMMGGKSLNSCQLNYENVYITAVLFLMLLTEVLPPFASFQKAYLSIVVGLQFYLSSVSTVSRLLNFDTCLIFPPPQYVPLTLGRGFFADDQASCLLAPNNLLFVEIQHCRQYTTPK